MARALSLIVLCLVVAAGVAVWRLSDAPPAQADIVPGEYSLEVSVAPTQVALGDEFTAEVGVFHNIPDGYQAVQWHVDYDPSVVNVVSMAPAPGAPPECVSKHDNGLRVLLSCLSFNPVGLSLSGSAWTVTFECIANGVSPVSINTNPNPEVRSWVKVGTLAQPAHVHHDSVECSDAVPTNTPTPVVTPPTPTPIVSPTGGTYGMGASVVESQVAVGHEFIAHAIIQPQAGLPYLAAQWFIEFDHTILELKSIARNAAAPVQCHTSVLNLSQASLLCETAVTNGLSYAGPAWDLTFVCRTAGSSELVGDPDDTNVWSGTFAPENRYLEQVTLINDTVECVDTPPYNGVVLSTDADGDGDTLGLDDLPAEGESAIASNLWLCADQSTDGIDNNGDSTVDNEPQACDGPGEGVIEIDAHVFSAPDCDTSGDDDDDDGKPIANDPNSPGFRPECPGPTLQDYIWGIVDKDGGELPEGLGALEFQIKFDHKIFDIAVLDPAEDGIDNDADTTVDEPDEATWTNGRFANCSMTIVTENDVRYGCTSTGTGLGLEQAAGELAATIILRPEEDLPFRIRATKDNGVLRRLLSENCQIADIYGDIFPSTNAGLTPGCTDVDVTVRRLEGDVDMDCDADVNDAQLIAFRYGSFFGHLSFDQRYDLEPWPTADFDIDIKDLQFVFGRLGSTCEVPFPNNQWPLTGGSVGQP